MGQAKQRGTFEERRQQAVELSQKATEARRLAIEAEWEVMPEEQKERYRQRPNGSRMMDSVILSLVLLGAMGGRKIR